MLWLNVLQCQKFYNCIKEDLAKISHNVQPVFSIYWISQSKEADDMKFLKERSQGLKKQKNLKHAGMATCHIIIIKAEIKVALSR